MSLNRLVSSLQQLIIYLFLENDDKLMYVFVNVLQNVAGRQHF